MSNEELAVAIQNGESGYITTLWYQVKKYIEFLVFNYCVRFQARCERAGVTKEDLMQVGFIALIDAIKAYDTEAGYKFTTFLSVQCKRHFMVAIGFHTNRAVNEPLNNSYSLHNLLNIDADDSKFIDFISDPDAETPFEDVIDDIWRDSLKEAIERALQLIDSQQAYIIRQRYFENKTLLQIANDMNYNPEYIRRYEHKALRSLRSGKCLKLLQPFHDSEYMSLGLRSVGYSAFTTHGSATERAVETLERMSAYSNHDKL